MHNGIVFNVHAIFVQFLRADEFSPQKIMHT